MAVTANKLTCEPWTVIVVDMHTLELSVQLDPFSERCAGAGSAYE